MKTFFKVTGIILGFCLMALFILGSIAPETSVYQGRQIPKRFMSTIRSLELLDEGEEIRYFYSDGLLSIKEGLYFVTDQNLVLYSKEWAEPETIIPLEEIISVDVEYDDSFFEDSWVTVMSESFDVSFPVSSEKGLDRKFVEAIREKLDAD